MTTTNTITNGRVRKSLAEQIDRLDHILDGLAEGLNDAVALAVKEAVSIAVQEAVRVVLAEVVTNTDLLAKLRTSTKTSAAAVVEKRSFVARATSKVGSWFSQGWRSLRRAGATVVGQITSTFSTTYRQLRMVRQLRVPLLTALVVGAVSGTGAYFGGPYVAAVAGWIAGFTTTISVQAGIWLRRAFSMTPTQFV